VNMAKAAHFRFHRAKHRVVGVAGVASFVCWDTMILEMGCSQGRRVIDAKTLPVRLHDVARETETSGLRAMELGRNAHAEAENGKEEEDQKSHHLTDVSRSDCRTRYKESDEDNAEQNQRDR